VDNGTDRFIARDRSHYEFEVIAYAPNSDEEWGTWFWCWNSRNFPPDVLASRIEGLATVWTQSYLVPPPRPRPVNLATPLALDHRIVPTVADSILLDDPR
jgi:hypothetical protein